MMKVRTAPAAAGTSGRSGGDCRCRRGRGDGRDRDDGGRGGSDDPGPDRPGRRWPATAPHRLLDQPEGQHREHGRGRKTEHPAARAR